MSKRWWLFSLSFIFVANSYAQTDIADFLKIYNNAKSDVQNLAEAYMEPLGKSLGQGFNSGWYTSAKPHKFGGFDFTISVTGVNIGSGMKTFNINDYLTSGNLKVVGSDPITSTVLGKDVDGPAVQAYVGNIAVPNAKMNMPQGVNLPMVPIPMYNIGVGLPGHTEIDLRFLPQISFGDGKASLFGFGIKNEFKEYIPVFKLLPFNVSAFFGYTKYNLKWDLEDNDYAASGYKDQELNSKSYAYTARLLISKSIPVLTVYGALGYNGGDAKFNMDGHYSVGGSPIIDPFALSYSAGNFAANLGLRLKLGVVLLYGDYTFSDYSLFSAGLGITFR